MRLRTAVTTVLMAAAATSGIEAQDAASLAVSKTNRTIAITATEHVTHMAEVGVVHVGFTQYGPTKDAVYNAGSATSNAIVKAMLAAGAGKNDIQSEAQDLGETQSFNNPPLPPAAERQARAFHLHQSWTVRVAADDAAKLLDVAVKAGANDSGQIDWQLADPNTSQAEAAAKAIQRAQAQAKAMASGLGVHLGDLLYASNQVEALPLRPMPRGLSMMMKDASPAAPPLAINAREIETGATVYAVFALE